MTLYEFHAILIVVVKKYNNINLHVINMRVDNEEQSYRSTQYYKSNIVILDEDCPVPSCALTQRICHGTRATITPRPLSLRLLPFSRR